MKILFTSVSASYACEELGRTLVNAIPSIELLAKEYENINDNRVLVIVLLCPYCQRNPIPRTERAVLVSPFRGIDSGGYNVHEEDKYPPFRNPGQDGGANDLNEFLDSFRVTINGALA